MTNEDRIVAFVEANPGCTVKDVCDHFDIDGGTAWFYLCNDCHGRIRSDNSDGGRWHFYPQSETVDR